MRANPIYRRERIAGSRSIRIPMILTVFNSILALAALLRMYSIVAQVEVTAEIQYSAFMELYVFGATIAFVMILFIMPALTAGSISGERERQTMDLLLSTPITGLEVAAGKLMASMYYVILLIVSSFPVMALSFVYGRPEPEELAFLILCFLAAALFTASIGICFSALCRKTTVATALSYGTLAFLTAGTYALNRFVWSMANMEMTGYANRVGGMGSQVNSGGFLYLLLLNPVVTFYEIIRGQTGWSETMSSVSWWFGSRPENFVLNAWVPVSVILQVVLACVFLAAAAWRLGLGTRGTGRFGRRKSKSREARGLHPSGDKKRSGR